MKTLGGTLHTDSILNYGTPFYRLGLSNIIKYIQNAMFHSNYLALS